MKTQLLGLGTNCLRALQTALAIIGTALLPGSVDSAKAALLAYEGFNYVPGSDLSGQSGGGSSGFGAAWGNTVGDIVSAGSFTYTDALGNALLTSGNKAFTTGASGSAQAARNLTFTRGAPGTRTWISLLALRSGPIINSDPPYFQRAANFALFNTADAFQERLAIGRGSSDSTPPMDTWATIALADEFTTVASTFSLSNLAFIVIRIDHVGDADVEDVAYMFINPPNLNVEPHISTAAAVNSWADFSFNRIRLFAGNTSVDLGIYAEMTFDEIRIGETFADVAPNGPGSPLPPGLQTAGPVFVDIDATSLSEGALTAVTNKGTLGGFFEARGGGDTVPRVAPVEGGGTLGIRFDGTDYLQHVASPGGAIVLADPGLVGVNATCTIEAWVLNGAIDREETIVAWGKRGGNPNGSNMAFNYGWDAAWGAVAHWSSMDMGWSSGLDGSGTFGPSVPAAGVWHHLVNTFDGATQRIYADGTLKNSESGPINPHAASTVTLAAQLEPDGVTPGPNLRASMTIGRLRIHDGVLSAFQVATNYNLEISTFTNGPGAPLAAGPIHRYQFNNPAGPAPGASPITDSVGGANGTVLGNGATFTGSKLTLPGGSPASAAFVDLPDGLLSSHSTNNGGTGEFTIEGWVRITGSRTWSRLFDFGSSLDWEGMDYLTYSAQVNNGVYERFCGVRNVDPVGGTGGGGDIAHGTTTFNQNFHFAVTWNDHTGEITAYENGAIITRRTETARIGQINDVNVWLGRSNWSSDQNAQGEFDEIRIYDRVLSEAELRGNFLRGPENVGPSLPGIVSQPQSRTNVAGSMADFTVTALGAQPLSYQWQFNGTDIQGATATNHTIVNVQLSDAGDYTVVVTNNSGSLTSAVATLTVIEANNQPIVANPIPDQTNTYGAEFTFTFAANTFTDPDAGQVLSYNTGVLPPGITFTPVTRTFSGTNTSVGTYSVTVTASDNGNPALSTNDVFDIVIAEAPLTVTGGDTNRVYGELNPAFTGTVAGLVLGDNITAVFTSLAETNSSPGAYPIIPGLVDPDTRLINYAVTTNLGTLTITAAPLTVTAFDTNRVYGTANPPLTGSLVGVVNGDNVTASFSTIATIASPPGTYPITPELSDPDSRLSNYLVTTNIGTLSVISPPTLSIVSGDGGVLTLSWPSSPIGFVLESTEILTPPPIWQEITVGIVEDGGVKSCTVTNNTGGLGRLFRLRLP